MKDLQGTRPEGLFLSLVLPWFSPYRVVQPAIPFKEMADLTGVMSLSGPVGSSGYTFEKEGIEIGFAWVFPGL